ncbi:SMP-30/gluconolactonase/LRE family protein [Cognaticolwellia beringensis]|uniref:Gluconolactonase n=1 Tax=Cognaticolwellia beringensis TaxID=1967665 RepID=A0A222GBX4_9GAMM|nr:SMP-30/gluconolactonase/LRE family protein [Cognaticolwellia beringensis]ASP49340.1 gluconolactonase [Cognaticolwellia beringensis]
MTFKLTNPKNIKLVSVVCISLLVVSCADDNEVQVVEQAKNNIVSNAVSNSVADANARYCSVGSSDVQLDLTNIKLVREQNIPLMYQGYNSIEGPVWYKGALYYSNMGSHQPDENDFVLSNQTTIWRWVQGSKPQVWIKDSEAGTNGLALDSKGNLIATRQLDGSLSSIDWDSKQITPMVSTYQNKRFNSPNDLTIGYDDTIYFTDPNWNIPSNINLENVQGGGQEGSNAPGQRIYRVTTSGAENASVKATKVTTLVPALSDKPNGIMLTLDQQQLIVGGLQGLWVFDLHSGEVANPKQLLNTPVDGLGKDCSGNIYVTTTRVMSERKDGQVVVILDKQLKEVGILKVPGIHIVTNIAFGGDDRKTLFVTGLTATMDGSKLRQCGDKACLKAGIYTTKLNVQGFPF